MVARIEPNLDETEHGSFWGRTHAGGVYRIGDKWICAVGSRDGARAVAHLVEPVGDHGWTVLLELCSDDEEYRWGPMIVGRGLMLSYIEAEQVAYAFQTEGEVQFDFHRGVAISIWGSAELGRITAMISERYDDRRTVKFMANEDGWFAVGFSEYWSEKIIWFVSGRESTRFPAQGYGSLEEVRALAYEWLVEPALGRVDQASGWWQGDTSVEPIKNKVTYLAGGY